MTRTRQRFTSHGWASCPVVGNTGGKVLGPQFAIPVPLLSIRLLIPTSRSCHDFHFGLGDHKTLPLTHPPEYDHGLEVPLRVGENEPIQPEPQLRQPLPLLPSPPPPSPPRLGFRFGGRPARALEIGVSLRMNSHAVAGCWWWPQRTAGARGESVGACWIGGTHAPAPPARERRIAPTRPLPWRHVLGVSDDVCG